MTVYKLMHVPSGMFFKPGRFEYGKPRTTLHPDGKVYTVKPTVKWLKGMNSVYSKQTGRIPIVDAEWEVITYEVG